MAVGSHRFVPLISGVAPGTVSPPGHLCGMEQLAACHVHTLEVAGSSPAPAIVWYISPFLPLPDGGGFSFVGLWGMIEEKICRDRK